MLNNQQNNECSWSKENSKENSTNEASEASITVGVLYESDEWSDYKLAAELELALNGNKLIDEPETSDLLIHQVEEDIDFVVRMIDMEQPDCIEAALECEVLVSRVFASSLNRGHEQALRNMEALIAKLEHTGTLLLNSPQAHAYEIDKFASTNTLREAGLTVPAIYQVGAPQELESTQFHYPCVIKPVCSGRTVDTAIVQTEEETRAFLANAPQRTYLVQEYIKPERSFITRVEIIGGKVALVVKRGVADNGLSAYRFGSTYQLYPDVLPEIVQDCETAATALGFTFGSFDVIESEAGNFFIDANSVSNVSEDNTEMFGRDLMREHAEEIARIVANRVVPSKEEPRETRRIFPDQP